MSASTPDLQGSAPQAPSFDGALGMADLAELEAMAAGADTAGDLPTGGEVSTGDGTQDQLPPEGQQQPQNQQNRTKEELLLLERKVAEETQKRQNLEERLSEYENAKTTQDMERVREELIRSFEVAEPAEIATEYLKLVNQVRLLETNNATSTKQALEEGRFRGLLSATDKYDPSFGKRFTVMEATFGTGAVEALLQEARSQQDPIGFLQTKLANITLPEDLQKATNDARLQAARNVLDKGQAPEADPTTGNLRGNAPAPATDLKHLQDRNLGMTSLEELTKLEQSLT